MGKDVTSKIDDKVKFWEQQDRMYKAIVPNLLKDQDLIEDVTEKISEYTDTIIRLEIKIQKLEEEIKEYQKQKTINRIMLITAVASCIIMFLAFVFS